VGSFGVLFGGDENDPLAKTNLFGPGVMRGPRYSVERSDPSRKFGFPRTSGSERGWL
jgi:hypothetical protein